MAHGVEPQNCLSELIGPDSRREKDSCFYSRS